MATFPRRQSAPEKGRKDYRVYRPEVREDFNGYCAYCGVHESEWPHEAKTYELDHFKPKSRPEFEHLKNDFYNLRWCCCICNGRSAKGDHWPSPEEIALGMHFVDLCEDDWQLHYRVFPNGKLEALTSQARYTVQVIGLDSDDYVKLRKRILENEGSLFQPNRS